MIERPCLFQQDQWALTNLWLAYRLTTGIKIYPTIWRLKLLLTSRVWEPTLDTRIWETKAGQMVGFAMLWRRQPQSPYLVLEYFIQPTAVTLDLFDAILRWGIQRARRIVQANQGFLTLFTSLRYNAIHSAERLETLGFRQKPVDEQEYNLYFTRALDTDLPKPCFPSGFSDRLMHSNEDLEAYRSIYNFSAVDPLHLRELLASEEYHHRIATDSMGNFVAYCEYSICRTEWQRSGQHVGWVDYIGTRPEYQRQGLGGALLCSSLQHLKSQGADTAMLVSVSTNTSAIGLYQKVQFNAAYVSEPPRYQISISPK